MIHVELEVTVVEDLVVVERHSYKSPELVRSAHIINNTLIAALICMCLAMVIHLCHSIQNGDVQRAIDAAKAHHLVIEEVVH